MSYVKSLFRWDRFAMIYDTDTEYRSVHNAIATLLRRPDGGNKVTSTHGVNPSKPDSEIRDIFLQIRKYARSQCDKTWKTFSSPLLPLNYLHAL